MMRVTFPDIHLLSLRFRALAPINSLPLFHGVQWSAMLRNALRAAVPDAPPLADAGISIQPVESGILYYRKGDAITLGFSFPPEQAALVEKLFSVLKSGCETTGHFIPGTTLVLEKATCRITGNEWSLENTRALTTDLLAPEIERLCSLENFTIVFTTPLRLYRPNKREGHMYCDEDFFRSQNSSSIAHIASRVCSQSSAMTFSSVPRVAYSALLWQEFSWQHGTKVKGGIVGSVAFESSPPKEMAERLVLGQYTGLGMHRAFGFGTYTIPELDGARRLQPLQRSTSLYARAIETETLRLTLRRLPKSAPGPDGMMVEDVQKGGGALLDNLSERLAAGTYTPGPSQRYAIPKNDGGHRYIYVQNAIDRLVQRSSAETLSPSIDGALSALAFAYRKNRNRRNALRAVRRAFADGYVHGIKADINSYFDSIDLRILRGMLQGLLPYEPMVARLFAWLPPVDSARQLGLPQGSPLSPMLSNLYLQGFDREIAQHDLKLIRYADDFVVLAKETLPPESVQQRVEQSLAPLGLRLNPEKTLRISANEAFTFLGYSVKGASIEELEEEKSKDDPWTPLFDERWRSGIPVYLSMLCQNAYSRDGALVLTDEQAQIQQIPWNNIGRIVIAGRTRFSGSVVYRAMKHRIPVTFIDVLGRLSGQFRPEQQILPDLREQLELITRQPKIQLMHASAVIAAKIRNSSVMLRRNHIESDELKAAERAARSATDIESLRGIEGAAAKEYFSHFAKLVQPFTFSGRVYHPSPDPVNVLLSFGYTLLYNRLSSALYAKGFDPRIGFYHQGRGSHAALASDLMEPLRHLVDRTVLALIHRKEITPDHFTEKKGSGYCRLTGEGFRLYIRRFEATMSTMFTNHRGERMSYNAYLDEVADDFRRSLQFGTPYEPLEID